MDVLLGKNVSLFVVREPQTGGDPAGDKFSSGVKVTQESLFSELEDDVYKGSRGPAGYFGSQNK